MVTTRSRKRVAGEGDGVTTHTTRSTRNHSTTVNAVLDKEPSVLPPKAKRQRTAAAVKATTTARTRKARALQPVATNAKAAPAANNSKPIATRVKPTKAKKKASSAKPAAASRATRRGRSAAQEESQSKPPEEEPKTEPQQGSVSASLPAAATGATRAAVAVDNSNTNHPNHNGNKELTGFISDYEVEPDFSNLKPTVLPVLRMEDYKETPESVREARAKRYENGVPDNIDARDANDPLSVTDYVEDMYRHFFWKEEATSVSRMYMGRAEDGRQPNINEGMRCILVDWLIEVHYKFKLFPETLYLTVNILDRFLSDTDEIITKRDLQLVGVTSLLVAAKYEEMYVPELRDLTYICDGAYTEAKILRMEEKILKTLHYNVTVPTPHTFLIRFLKAAHADKLMAQLASFLLDGTLLTLEKLTCRWRPSQLAAAAILLARRQIGRHNWSPTLVAYSSGYKEEDVLPCARALLEHKHRLDANRELMALAKKYSKTKYGKVSHIEFLPLVSSSEESAHAIGSGDESMDDSDL